MRLQLVALVGFLACNNCVHTPTPPPAPPGPASDLCGLEQAAYDNLTDGFVGALGADDSMWAAQVDQTARAASIAEATAVCVLQNIAYDLDDAPVEQERARDWLTRHGNASTPPRATPPPAFRAGSGGTARP
jgi:hypothetical protein